jgi:hypothetical protein
MNNDELRQLNANRKIYQIAFLTTDLERSMSAWLEKFKIGPWTVLDFTNESMEYLKVDDQIVTEPFRFRIAIATVGDIDFELIQPVYGPTIYQDYLNRHGEGFHHFKEKIADGDLEQVIADYAASGIRVLQTGKFDIDYHYYLDTEGRADFIYELGNCPKLVLPEHLFTTYPAEQA